MSRRKQIKSKAQFEAALALEKSGDTTASLKLYQKATSTDATNTHAWNRQMIIYRKNKSKEEEVKLIKLAIAAYQKSTAIKQQDWQAKNKQKADSTRELAKVLGLLEPSGHPKNDDTTIEKWQTRLYLLTYRIKNARKKKPTKKPISNSKKRIVKPKVDTPTTKKSGVTKKTVKK